ncbi:hypothetical protein K438DRAFT_2058825, partial [Mycena galopus ATCC 62051]
AGQSGEAGRGRGVRRRIGRGSGAVRWAGAGRTDGRAVPLTASAILDHDSMPLLNAFIKETLRLYPAGALSERIAIQDTVIPLMDTLKTSTEELTKHIRVGKGQIVTMAIASYQTL